MCHLGARFKARGATELLKPLLWVLLSATSRVCDSLRDLSFVQHRVAVASGTKMHCEHAAVMGALGPEDPHPA